MTQAPRRARGRLQLAAMACAAFVVTAFAVLVTSAPAQAHGNVNDPIARGYRCLKLYGDTHLSTAYRDSDPMCWQAFQESPDAMWNWNGMLVDGLGGNYQSVTDICSGGMSRYAVLSRPGNWIATTKPTSFRLNLVDQASHGADFMRVYISRNGFDPTTQRLGWGDVVQIAETGRIPTSGNGTVDPAVGGSAYAMDVNASGYTGRRVLFTMWKASHADQTYFLCSDVNIGGTGSTTPPASTTRPPTTTSPPVTTPPVTTRPPTTTPPSTGGVTCTATLDQWNGGYTATVSVRAGSSPVNGWTVKLGFASAPSVTNAWNATVATSGTTVTATNVNWNASIGAGGSTTFGFQGTGNGNLATPTCSV